MKSVRTGWVNAVSRLPILLFAPALLFGCVTRPLPFVPFSSDVTVLPRTVAAMPLDNQTNSVPGAIYLRRAMWQNLARKGYVALPLEQTDLALAEQFGLSLGGQITEEIIPEIGRALQVDAVLTGTLQHFGARLSFSAEEEVEATFALYETATGRKIWEAHERTRTKLLKKVPHETPEERATEFLAGIATGFVFNLIDRPLAPAVFELVETLIGKMPNGAGTLHPHSTGTTTHTEE